jgi:hypothetical protein
MEVKCKSCSHTFRYGDTHSEVQCQGIRLKNLEKLLEEKSLEIEELRFQVHVLNFNASNSKKKIEQDSEIILCLNDELKTLKVRRLHFLFKAVHFATFEIG